MASLRECSGIEVPHYDAKSNEGASNEGETAYSSDADSPSTDYASFADQASEMQDEVFGDGYTPSLDCYPPADHSEDEDEMIVVETKSEYLDSALMAQIPMTSNGQFTSVGSIEHEKGTCKPCLYWYHGQCAKGILCTYCHIKHKGKAKRIRPGKAWRQHLKAVSEAELKKEPEEAGCTTPKITASLPPGLETPVVAIRNRNSPAGGQNDGCSYDNVLHSKIGNQRGEVGESTSEHTGTKLRSSAALFCPQQPMFFPYTGAEAWPQFSSGYGFDGYEHMPYWQEA